LGRDLKICCLNRIWLSLSDLVQFYARSKQFCNSNTLDWFELLFDLVLPKLRNTVLTLWTDKSNNLLNLSRRGAAPTQPSNQKKVLIPLLIFIWMLSSNQLSPLIPNPSQIFTIFLHQADPSLQPSLIRPPSCHHNEKITPYTTNPPYPTDTSNTTYLIKQN